MLPQWLWNCAEERLTSLASTNLLQTDHVVDMVKTVWLRNQNYS